MSLDPQHLSEEVQSFLRERHLASLTLLRSDGSPHVTAVGFTWDEQSQLVRVITWAGSMKKQDLGTERLESSSCVPNRWRPVAKP